jgi:hypothetical protein
MGQALQSSAAGQLSPVLQRSHDLARRAQARSQTASVGKSRSEVPQLP